MDLYAVLNLFRSDPLPFYFASIVTYLVLIAGARRQLVALEDYLHVQIIMISAYASVIAVAFLRPEAQPIGLMVLLVLYFFGMVLAFQRGTTPAGEKQRAPERKRVFTETIEGKLFAVVVMATLVLNFTVNIMSGDFVVGETAVSQRYSAYESNPILKIVGRPILYFSVFLVYAYRGTWLGRVAVIVLGLVALQSPLVGSKAFMLQWMLFAAYWLYLVRLDNPRYKPPRLALYYGASIAIVSGPLWILYIGATEGDYNSGIQHLLERLFLGMNHLPEAGLAGIAGQVPELSLAQFYLAPILKAFGAYSSQYDGINHYYVTHVLGWHIDYDGMRPNNNLILELVLTQGWVVAAIATPILAYMFFAAYIWLRKRRWDSFLTMALFLYFTSLPFFWLIDGSAWLNGLIGLGVFYVIWFVSAAFAKLFLNKSSKVRY
jgi:hypothetical protein